MHHSLPHQTHSWQSYESDAAVIHAKRVIRPFAKGTKRWCWRMQKIGIWKVICRYSGTTTRNSRVHIHTWKAAIIAGRSYQTTWPGEPGKPVSKWNSNVFVNIREEDFKLKEVKPDLFMNVRKGMWCAERNSSRWRRVASTMQDLRKWSKED